MERPTVVLAFNDPSTERFASELVPGGLHLPNPSIMTKTPRAEITILLVPATEAAMDLGNSKVANMVMLGKNPGQSTRSPLSPRFSDVE